MARCRQCEGPLVTRDARIFCSQSCAIGYRNRAEAVEARRRMKLPAPVRGARWIPLNIGCALVDARDFARLSKRLWYWAGDYVRALDINHPYLHHVVLGVRSGAHVDHRNGDARDNRRRNLRRATRSQNNHNMHSRGGSSKYKGVSKRNDCRGWYACIFANGRTLNLGTYLDEKKAARAYDAAARKYFGDFARVNFPRRGEQGALR